MRWTSESHHEKSNNACRRISLAQDMIRCKAFTKANKQCSVTNRSSWTNEHGRLVAEPLLRGGEFCLFHSKPFCTTVVQVEDFDRLLIFILDLETTGVDITKDRVVEIAAIQCRGDARMHCASFSTTVQVDPLILKERGKQAFEVHGITDVEIQNGPSFKQAWERFLEWIDDLTNTATIYDSDSDDDLELPTILEDPVVVLVGHNAFRFDFPFLLCELLRHNLSTTIFGHWYFVDTLHVFKDCNQYGCVKLQCLARDTMMDPGHAHRALDDCVVLGKIANIFAQRLGVSTQHLLSMYLVELDLASSIAQLTVLM